MSGAPSGQLVRVIKPMSINGQSIPAGTLLHLPADLAMTLHSRCRIALVGRSATQAGWQTKWTAGG